VVRVSLLISPWPAALLIRKIFAANGAKLGAASQEHDVTPGLNRGTVRVRTSSRR
jgi:hypothetical protein